MAKERKESTKSMTGMIVVEFIKKLLGKFVEFIVSTSKRLFPNRSPIASSNTTATEPVSSWPWLVDGVPLDLLVKDIICRLPVKSIFRLSSVSKLFYSLISDPCFVTTHLNQSITNTKKSHVVINCVGFIPYSSHLFSVQYSSSATAQFEYMFPIQDMLPSEHISYHVIGSCHGLLCLTFFPPSNSVYLINPSTRQSKLLPRPHFNFYQTSDEMCKLGFGYDQSRDDYKLVSATSKVCQVYSLKSDSWIKIDSPHSQLHFAKGYVYGTLLNGSIHWFCGDSPPCIIAFSLSDHTFSEIEVPEVPLSSPPAFHVLDLVGGCLCILTDWYSYSFSPKLWVMKECGWTQIVFQIPSSAPSKIRRLAFLDNHEALFLELDSNKLVLCNTRDRTWRHLLSGKKVTWWDLILTNSPNVTCILDVVPYAESLVSPCHRY